MKPLNYLLMTFLIPISIGCLDQGSSSAESGEMRGIAPKEPDISLDPGSGDSAESAITMEYHTGDGFECLLYEKDVWCLGNVQDMFNEVDFELVFRSTNSVAMSARDDSLCIETIADNSPFNRTNRTAVYCFGEAALDWPYTMYDIVFGGPIYDHAANGSANVYYPTDGSNSPFMGGDLTLDTFLNQTTYIDEIWPDTAITVSYSTIECTEHTTTIECPGSISLTKEP